tara:strand:- start:158 stop:433 length:276 start_codon:yes stop_codon:yes gene_type:complete
MTEKNSYENEENSYENEDNKFRYLSNLDNLINLHEELKYDYIYHGMLNTSRTEDFIKTILDNICFIDMSDNDDDDNNDNNDNLNSVLYNEQ